MTTTIGAFADRHPKITLAIIAVAFVAITAAGVWAFVTPDEPTATDRACMDKLGDEWSAGGWIGSYPPAIACNGPGGDQVIIKMPKDVREEEGVLLPRDVQNTTESGNLSLQGLPAKESYKK